MNAKHPAGSLWKRSQVVKRSIVIAGRKTSMSLEDAFWSALKEIAATRKIFAFSDLVSAINNERKYVNLSSAIRLFVLDHYRRLAELKREKD